MGHCADLGRVFTGHQWSGFDVRYLGGRDLAERTSNPKLHWNQYFASGPLIPTFAKVLAATGRECWNRTTGLAFVEFLAKSLPIALDLRRGPGVSSRSFFVIDPARKGAKTNFPFRLSRIS